MGKLGRFDFPAGLYVYCGSAQGNLPARIARHRRRRKRLHWHVDYLLANRAAKVIGVETRPGGRAGECELVGDSLARGGQVVAKGFGAGDCPQKGRCQAHLLWLGPAGGHAAGDA